MEAVLGSARRHELRRLQHIEIRDGRCAVLGVQGGRHLVVPQAGFVDPGTHPAPLAGEAARLVDERLVDERLVRARIDAGTRRRALASDAGRRDDGVAHRRGIGWWRCGHERGPGFAGDRVPSGSRGAGCATWLGGDAGSSGTGDAGAGAGAGAAANGSKTPPIPPPPAPPHAASATPHPMHAAVRASFVPRIVPMPLPHLAVAGHMTETADARNAHVT